MVSASSHLLGCCQAADDPGEGGGSWHAEDWSICFREAGNGFLPTPFLLGHITAPLEVGSAKPVSALQHEPTAVWPHTAP